MKRIYVGVLITILLATAVLGALDSFEFSRIIQNGIYTGVLTKEDGTDYYRVYVQEGDTLEIKVYAHLKKTSRHGLPVLLEGSVSLIDYQSRQEVFSEKFTSQQSVTKRFAVPKKGYYVIHVQREFYEGDYTLELSLTGANDAATNTDAPSETDKALELIPDEYTATLSTGDDSDIYKVQLHGGDRINVTLKPRMPLRIDATVITGDYVDPITSTSSEGQEVTITNALGSSFFAEWAYIKVTRVQGEGSYFFTVTVAPQDDAHLREDAKDEMNLAREIAAGRHMGFIGGVDRKDYYRVYLPAEQKSAIVVHPSEDLGIRVTLYNAKSGETTRYEEGRKGEQRIVSFIAEDQAYVVGIEAYEGSGTYEFMIGPEMSTGEEKNNQSAFSNLTEQQQLPSPRAPSIAADSPSPQHKKSSTRMVIIAGSIAMIVLLGLLVWLIVFLRRY